MDETSDTIKHGPFTWKRDREIMNEDRWELDTPSILGFTCFCVKNYGGAPGPGFAGWKLVSGGPFDDAGAYATRDEAIKGATPWLVAYYHREAKRRLNDAQEMIRRCDEMERILRSEC